MNQFDENQVKQTIKEESWKGDFDQLFQDMGGEQIAKKRKKSFTKLTIIFVSSLLAVGFISSGITASVIFLHQNGVSDRCLGKPESNEQISTYLSRYPYYSDNPVAFSTGDEGIYAKYYYASTKTEEHFLVVNINKDFVSSVTLSFLDSTREPVKIDGPCYSVSVSTSTIDFAPTFAKTNNESYIASPLSINFVTLQQHFGF